MKYCECSLCGYDKARISESELLFSIPTKYRYVCPFCGHIGYISIEKTKERLDSFGGPYRVYIKSRKENKESKDIDTLKEIRKIKLDLKELSSRLEELEKELAK